jgi:WS/DGAT/MGAT family acyltransferase
VLTVVTGAVREYLILRGVDPSSLSFRVSAPVSVRNAEERGKLGNRVSSWVIELPLTAADPLEQLAAIHAETGRLKEERTALGVETIMKLAEFTPPALLTLGARAASGPINTIVTNVPGPQFPLYLMGSRMLEAFPIVPLTRNLTVVVGIVSYDGTLHFGLWGDRDACEDLEVFAGGIDDAFGELLKAVDEDEPT